MTGRLIESYPHGTLIVRASMREGGGPHRGSDPVQCQTTNRVRAGRQQR